MRGRGRAQRVSAPRRRSMGSYRVYKVGEEEHVREAAGRRAVARRRLAAAPSRAAARRPRRGAGGSGRSSPRPPWSRRSSTGSTAARPSATPGPPSTSPSLGQGAGLGGAGGAGRRGRRRRPGHRLSGLRPHLAVKLVGVAVVVLVLATPGLAVGYANGLVSDVGGTGSAARTAEEIARDRGGRRGDRPADPRQADEHPAHRLGQEHRPRRPRALGHADARAPRPGDQEHLDALAAARPAGRHPRRTAWTR